MLPGGGLSSIIVGGQSNAEAAITLDKGQVPKSGSASSCHSARHRNLQIRRGIRKAGFFLKKKLLKDGNDSQVVGSSESRQQRMLLPSDISPLPLLGSQISQFESTSPNTR